MGDRDLLQYFGQYTGKWAAAVAVRFGIVPFTWLCLHVTLIGEFWQPFWVGKNDAGHQARPQKTTIARGKRHLLDSAGAVKLFARLSELMFATFARAVAIFCSRNESAKITEYRDTAPLRLRREKHSALVVFFYCQNKNDWIEVLIRIFLLQAIVGSWSLQSVLIVFGRILFSWSRDGLTRALLFSGLSVQGNFCVEQLRCFPERATNHLVLVHAHVALSLSFSVFSFSLSPSLSLSFHLDRSFFSFSHSSWRNFVLN